MKKPPKTLWVNVYKDGLLVWPYLLKGTAKFCSATFPPILGTFKYVLEEKKGKK